LEGTSGIIKSNQDGGSDLFSLGRSDRTHRNGSKLHQWRFRLDTRKHFFTERMVKRWSRLPREVGNAPSLSMFEAFGQCKKHLGMQNMLLTFGQP